MQYNKQLFIGDYWIFSCIYQLVLPGSLFVSIRFVVLITPPLSLFHWSLTVHRWDIREKSKKTKRKTIYLPQRVPCLGIQFSLLPIGDLNLCTELNNDLIATSLLEFPGRFLQLPALLCETSLLRDQPYRARM